ncbi:MAG: branched-chain amino acid ABC transporter permease [Candidatus Sumerlaeia bacterium]|nr:branched-chain amino acid ABC transporter permease [Candidatus Sumerlaeia bacterium]
MELTNTQILLQYFVQGLPFGALVALIAVGYTMVYGIIQLVNFAHGEVFMFGAYIFLTLITDLDLPGETSDNLFWGQALAVILAITWATTLNVFLPQRLRGSGRAALALGLGGAAGASMYPVLCQPVPFLLAYPLAVLHTATIGVTMDRAAYRPLRRAPRLTALITAIGVSFFLLNLAQGIWEARPRTLPSDAVPRLLQSPATVTEPLGWAETVRTTGRIPITSWLDTSVRDVVIVCVCLAAMLALRLLIMRSRIGKAMRACSQDKTTARLVGINVDYVVAVTFATGAAMAALAAPLYILKGNFLAHNMGYIVGVLAFASAVLGGIGNIPGALLGGFLIGTVTTMAPSLSRLDGPGWLTSLDLTPWSYSVAYVVMIAIIIFRPTGLLGRASATRA